MDVLNLGILAHVDAGKTTVTEAMLHYSGAIRRLGRVDHGDTIADSLSIERERGITVRASTVSFRYGELKINLLDTPGHMDFVAEVERSLTVLDGAVLVLSAREGVQSQTRVLFAALQRLRIPTILFVNKLDRVGADFARTLAQARAQLSPCCFPRAFPCGEDLVSALLDSDENLAERYLREEPLDEAALRAAYLRCVAAGKLYPVCAGVALTETGIPELLEAVEGDLPRAKPVEGPLSALVYKLEFHPRFGRACYLRVYGGALKLRMQLEDNKGAPFRVSQLFTPEMGALVPTDAVPCGDIAVLPCTSALGVGDSLGTPPPGRMARLSEPLLLSRLTAGTETPREKLLTALKQLAAEDPLLDFSVNEQTGALEMRVFGEVQMEVLRALAAERYGIALTFAPPQTIFRETPADAGTGEVPWHSTPFAAAMRVSVRPLALGEGLQYATKVDYGFLTQSYQVAVREGLLRAAKYAVYGWELTDALLTLEWADYDSVNSTPAAYRAAAPVALIKALADAGTRLNEPILDYTLIVPGDCAGRAAYDLTQMRATMAETSAEGESIRYAGLVPLDASKRYAQTCAAYTRGQGVFSVRLHGYAPYAGDPEAVANEAHRLPSVARYLLEYKGRI